MNASSNLLCLLAAASVVACAGTATDASVTETLETVEAEARIKDPKPAELRFVSPASPPDRMMSWADANERITYEVDVPINADTFTWTSTNAIAMHLANLWRATALSHAPTLQWEAFDWFGSGCDYERCVLPVRALARRSGGVLRAKLVVKRTVKGVQRPDTTPTQCAKILEEEIVLDFTETLKALNPDPTDSFFDTFIRMIEVSPVTVDLGTIPCH